MTREKSYKVLFLGRLLIGLIFAYSGYTKLMEPVENFQGGIAAYQVIPYALIPWIARVVPWLEFLFGAFMIVGYMTRVSAAVLGSMSLSFVFLILTTWTITGALPADCGCFGEGSLIHLSPIQVLMLDVVNTVIAVKLLFTSLHPFSLDSLLTPKP